MFSRFFIRRPVFAGVLAIIIFLAGGLSIPVLPIEQYPAIAPPTVQITAVYPGANAQTVVDSVTAPIEQQVTGVEGMIYMSSQSSDDGRMTITVTFRLGTDIDMAAVRVQNRVALAEPRLPAEVRAQGVNVAKQSTSLLMVLSLYSPERTFDELYMANFASINIVDELARVDGVGGVALFGGSEYSMRVWLDPDLLAARGVTAGDIVAALREQNVQVAAGRVGQEPTPDDAGFQYTLSALGRLTTVDQFQDIVVRTGEDGETLLLREVARVELGAQSYDSFSRLDGEPSPAFGIYQLPGSNAVDVAAGVKEAMNELRSGQNWPNGLEYQVTYDFTAFVVASILEVVVTIAIAAVLVFLTVFVFLQDWRATLVPAVAMPVSIVGSLAVLLAAGYSLNMLTLFGLVLAIGVVVDDAIVVVENCARLIDEEGLGPREAAIRSMSEITGPVIATTLVLLAVFVPTAVLPGITGELYRQFAVTISVATVISSVNALTLSPALCAILLRPSRGPRRFIGWRAFNGALELARAAYTWTVRGALRVSIVVLVLYAGVAAATVWAVRTTPTGFLPMEDQSVVFANIQLPDAARLGRTDAVLTQAEAMAADIPGVRDVIGLGGRSLISGTTQSNVATVIAILDPWEERTTPDLSAEAITGRMGMTFAGIQEAIVFPFRPPPIQGLGLAGGFEMQVQDVGARGFGELQDVTNDVTDAANATPGLTNVFSPFRARVPKLFVDIDRAKAKRQDLALTEVFGTLQANMGSQYVNDFNRFGRVYQVRVQADNEFRQSAEDVMRLEMRNSAGDMVPMSSIATVETTVGPDVISRYNLYPSTSVRGSTAPGLSSGDAVALMESIVADRLPRGFDSQWTGTTYQQNEAGNMAPLVFGLAIVFVYLVLAAQYESWTTPLAILATVPVGILGAMLAIRIRNMPNDIYVQVGLVLLVALVCKNAILIVEFARQRRAEGESVRAAAIEAASLRFRPILMTSFSFILGTLPLMLATGAGAASRQAIGTTVIGGMVLATIVGVFFIPTLDAVVQSTVRRVWGRGDSASSTSAVPAEATATVNGDKRE
ncbi:MAG: efflux RND transporter permease subunit [Phycisphaerales bacterium]